MSIHRLASDVLVQLIKLEQQHGQDAPGAWELVRELGALLETLPTAQIFDLIHKSRSLFDDQGYWGCISALRRRGDQETFDQCVIWARDGSPEKRVAAADILAELGYLSGLPFATQTLPLLEPFLDDDDAGVIASALWAFGKLKIGDPAVLAALVTHADADIRSALVGALSGRDDQVSISGLVLLTRDRNRDVRNWATFGLGQLTEVDSPEIRAALLERLDDSDPALAAEICGEALIGLARRGDLRVIGPLRQELAGPFRGAWCIEAAEVLKDERLLPLLIALRSRLEARDVSAFGDHLDRAIAACVPKVG
jgi:HEAT repeats/PBS lyase HEAT-like repeat